MSTKRYFLLVFAALAGVFSLQPVVVAESEAAKTKPGDRLGGLREQMQETAKELNLTEEQKQKLQAIIRERMEKLRELRQDNSLSREQKMEKFKAARDEIAGEVKNVLSPDQFEKWKAKQGQLFGGAAPAPAGGSSGARLQDAIKAFNLTDAQKEQLKPVYEEQFEKLRDLRQDTSLSMAQKMEKLKAAQQAITPKLKEVLDAEQFARWEKESQRWLEQLQQRFQGQKQD